jgi:hydroxymethylglutaryl-CoA reductase
LYPLSSHPTLDGEEPIVHMTDTHSSRLEHFYRLTTTERAERIAEWAGLDAEEQRTLAAGLDLARADRMIENVVGAYALPLGIATNFRINDRDYLVPMVIEEPSVVAGASYAARLVRDGGGFQVDTTDPLMIAQMQVLDVRNLWNARLALLSARERILELAAGVDPVVVSLGGGPRDLEVRVFEQSPVGPMLVLHLIYDSRDAMGANTVNTIAEALKPVVEELTGGRVLLRILSNLADRRLARARCRVPKDSLTMSDFAGERVVRGIVEAYALAAVDPYRAATHNKGIMNGVDAVVVATGNDWRAIEAGAHAYAARSGRYTSLSQWDVAANGDLVGTLELPMAVGTVGGATKVHPTARLALKIMGIQSARELAGVIAAVGLAQNLAAIRALATEGIQRGHMGLHARQVALSVGATGAEVEQVAERLVRERVVRSDRAEQILRELRHDR